MTAGTTHTEPKKSLAGIDDDFAQLILTRQAHRFRILANLAGQQAGGRHQKTGRRILANLISRNLLADELIKGSVLVERLNHIVSVWPSVRARRVHFESVGIRITHHVQPMLRPTFSITRGGEQSIHCFGKGDLCQSRIFDEFFHRIRTGRQAGQIQGRAPQQGDPICLRRRFQIVFTQRSVNEIIDGIALGRYYRALHGLE